VGRERRGIRWKFSADPRVFSEKAVVPGVG
jgi:hypothetical protein